MSTGFTSSGMGVMLRAMFIPDTLAMPSSMQFAVTYSIPVMNATGDQLDEPEATNSAGAATGYARANIEVSSSTWGISDFGEVYNIVPIGLGTPATQWGPLQGWALVDSGTNECLVVGELIDPLDPVPGQALSLPIAGIVIGLYG